METAFNVIAALLTAIFGAQGISSLWQRHKAKQNADVPEFEGDAVQAHPFVESLIEDYRTQIDAMRAEVRADLIAARAEIVKLRADWESDRVAWQADKTADEAYIADLTEHIYLGKPPPPPARKRRK